MCSSPLASIPYSFEYIALCICGCLEDRCCPYLRILSCCQKRYNCQSLLYMHLCHGNWHTQFFGCNGIEDDYRGFVLMQKSTSVASIRCHQEWLPCKAFRSVTCRSAEVSESMKEVVLVYRLSQLYDTSYTTYCDGSPVSANISRTLQRAFMVCWAATWLCKGMGLTAL